MAGGAEIIEARMLYDITRKQHAGLDIKPLQVFHDFITGEACVWEWGRL